MHRISLTVILITHATRSPVLVIRMNITNTPTAAISSRTLKQSWMTRVALIHHLVAPLMGFQ